MRIRGGDGGQVGRLPPSPRLRQGRHDKDGKHQQMEISPFLLDIEEKLLERSKTQLWKRKARRTHEQLDLL